MTNIIASIPPERVFSDSRRVISDPFKGAGNDNEVKVRTPASESRETRAVTCSMASSVMASNFRSSNLRSLATSQSPSAKPCVRVLTIHTSPVW